MVINPQDDDEGVDTVDGGGPRSARPISAAISATTIIGGGQANKTTTIPPISPPQSQTQTPTNTTCTTPNSSEPSSSGDAVLATAGYDHTIKLWQVGTALCLKTFQHPDSVG